MKNFTVILVIILCAILLVMSVRLNAGSTFEEEELLIVPKAAHPPVIDGRLDPIWKNVANHRLQVYKGGISPTNWLDFFSCARLMWDENNFYIFVSIQDEILIGNHADFWENDEVEIFFDGDNSKNSQAVGYDENDEHLFFPYSGVPHCSEKNFDLAQFESIILQTELGWNLEVAIPFAAMTFAPIENYEFGFSIFAGDNDNGIQREHYVRRWATYLYLWLNPSCWGTAKLSDRVVSEVLDVNFTNRAPQIDGEIDELWNAVPIISQNTYVTDDSLWDITLLNNWRDLQLDYRVLWDNTNFYAFIDVVDDRVNHQQTNASDKDGVELFFDGDNSKTEGSYDDNDDRLIFGYDSTLVSVLSHIDISNIQFAFTRKRFFGWYLEVAIPLADLKINPTAGHQFGFEVQINDNDQSDVCEHKARWWSNSIEAEQNPQLFGTAELKQGSATAVENSHPARLTDNYYLSQNHPNPFNPETSIEYQLPHSAEVNLTIYNLQGQKVRELVNATKAAGIHSVRWNGRNELGQLVASGLYFYRLEVVPLEGEQQPFVEVKKMSLMK